MFIGVCISQKNPLFQDEKDVKCNSKMLHTLDK